MPFEENWLTKCLVPHLLYPTSNSGLCFNLLILEKSNFKEISAKENLLKKIGFSTKTFQSGMSIFFFVVYLIELERFYEVDYRLESSLNKWLFNTIKVYKIF